jgi:hypothetical protein
MYLSDQEKANIIEYFLNHTYYTREYLTGIKNHAQLFSMYKRTKERMYEYPKEIIAYYNSHPEIYVRPTDEEIRKMRYEELSNLRKELGIRKKTTKKVTKTVEAKSTADKAREVLRKEPTSKVAAQVIISNMSYEEEHDYDHEQFLTPDEIEMMYPGEELTADELAERGIIVTPYFGVEEPRTSRKK